MAGKTSRTSAEKPLPKDEGRAKSRPDEPDPAGKDGDGESSPSPAGDGSRVAVLGRSVVSPRLKR